MDPSPPGLVDRSFAIMGSARRGDHRGVRFTSVAAERIVPGVWRVLKGYVNAYVVESDDGLALVDCGLPKRAPRIAAAITEAGHRPADVRHILITHHHYDHVG